MTTDAIIVFGAGTDLIEVRGTERTELRPNGAVALTQQR